MNLPEKPESAVRRTMRAAIIVLTALAALPAQGRPQSAPEKAEVRAVSADARPCLDLTQRPSRRARIVDCLEPGSRVTVTRTRGLWSRVTTESGASGWVATGFLVAVPEGPPSAARESGATATPTREQPEQAPAPAAPEAPPAAPTGAAPKAPVRIVVESASGAAPASAQADSELGRLAERARLAEQLVATLEDERYQLVERARLAEEQAAVREDERDRLTERARVAEERAAALEEERDRLAERARLAEERAAALEEERDQLAERARLAEERSAVLEDETEAAGETEETGGAEAGSPDASLEDLIRERDRLDGELRREQARMLFLRSDLEETRAELMRLKGVPAQLVQPESEPEPAPVPVAPEPALEPPADAAEPEAPALPATPSFVVLDQVVGTVRAWAQAWADQRVEDYLSFYSPSFTPPDGQSREAWAAWRRERIRAPRSIVITLDRINPIVSGDRASVSFEQVYASETFSDTVSKTLVLERTSGASWQIVEERAE